MGEPFNWRRTGTSRYGMATGTYEQWFIFKRVSGLVSAKLPPSLKKQVLFYNLELFHKRRCVDTFRVNGASSTLINYAMIRLYVLPDQITFSISESQLYDDE